MNDELADKMECLIRDFGYEVTFRLSWDHCELRVLRPRNGAMFVGIPVGDSTADGLAAESLPFPAGWWAARNGHERFS